MTDQQSRDVVELLSRAMCKADGTDPNQLNGAVGVAWKLYEPEVTAALEELATAGFKILPREPTPEMIEAGVDHAGHETRAWLAMWDAAP